MCGGFIFLLLANDVREKRHEAGALYRLSKRALPRSGEPRAAARHDFAVRIEEFLHSLHIFVVDAGDLRCVEVLFHNN